MSDIAEFLVNLMSAGDHHYQAPDIERTKWITKQLQEIGCRCDYQVFDDTANVYATFGNKDAKKNLCFCGHCDVVPARNWTKNPSGEIIGDRVYGRGAVDMLGGVACWFCALKAFKENDIKNNTSILDNVKITTFLTGDEEGNGTHGTVEAVEYLLKRGEKIDACIVGEPTSDYSVYEKNVSDLNNTLNFDKKKLDGVCYSRGGSFHFWIKINGKSGHVAYVGEFDNPITKAVKLCEQLKQMDFKNFGHMTNLEIVEFDATNNTDNVILDDVKIHGNVRFFSNLTKLKQINSYDDSNLIQQMIKNVCDDVLGENYQARYQCDRIGYSTDCDDDFLTLVMSCMKDYNQDARFTIVRGCTDGEYMKRISDSVCELGLKCKMMHKIDEYVTIQDLHDLTRIYNNIITKYVAKNK